MEQSYILYYECKGSLPVRNAIGDFLETHFKCIDMTGGQAAFIDGDLELFGNMITEISHKNNFKLYRILRMHDPGLGLCFSESWINENVDNGTFQTYELPYNINANSKKSKKTKK